MKLVRKNLPRGGGTLSFRQIMPIFSITEWLRGSKGAILIEFAFSIPVFLTLIYYLHDIPRAQRYKQQMNFVAQQMSQMLQTVSQGRSNKRITWTDIKNAALAAYLTMYPGVSMKPTQPQYFPLGFYVEAYVYYVVGEANGKASAKWWEGLYYTQLSPSYFSGSEDDSSRLVRFLRNADPAQIHSSLTIKPGEVKMIVECQLRHHKDKHFSDGRKCSDVSFREMFGFLFYNPSPLVGKSTDYKSCYIGTAIFAPRDGLFSSSMP